jgi:hypothetical protein
VLIWILSQLPPTIEKTADTPSGTTAAPSDTLLYHASHERDVSVQTGKKAAVVGNIASPAIPYMRIFLKKIPTDG